MARRPAVLALLLSLGGASAHGHLTTPAPRVLKSGVRLPSGRTYIEDEDAPVNFKGDGLPEATRRPVMDPQNHPDGASFVCDISNSNAAGQATSLQAGVTMALRFDMAAEHQGNADVFLSYDHDAADTLTMQWFKIAQLPQPRCNNKETLQINLPSWLPPGRAVVRWAWYALHTMDEAVEFYAKCADVEISSTSTTPVSAIPKYIIEVSGRGGGSADGEGSYPFEDDGSTYWQHWEERSPFRTWEPGYQGPACVGGVQGNCCDLSFYTPHIVASSQQCRSGGFDYCATQGDSGPAEFLAEGGDGADGGDPPPGDTGGSPEGSPPDGAAEDAASELDHLALVVSLSVLGACAAAAAAFALYWRRCRRAPSKPGLPVSVAPPAPPRSAPPPPPPPPPIVTSAV